MISYLQAIVIGLIQGVTELFPISSLGHSVLVPAWLGWHNLSGAQTEHSSFFLTFLVAVHVGTALALLLFYWRTWVTVAKGFGRSLSTRSLDEPDARLAWLLIGATIPVALVGLVFQTTLREQFAKPLAASIFLTLNGVLLLGGEMIRRRSLANAGRLRATKGRHVATSDREAGGFRKLDTLSLPRGIAVGCSQILALLAGISRSGVTMVAGITAGLDHEDAARYSFLLATPVILLAGLYQLPSVLGHSGHAIRGQCLVGAIAAGLAAYGSVKFLVKWFETRTLWPFGVYSLIVGLLCLVRFG